MGCWQCVCWGLAHGEAWGLGPAPAARGGSRWAELARSGRRFRKSGGLGGGRRGARSCATAGRPRSAEGSWCGPEDLHFACWPGCAWRVAGGARRRSENGRARPAQVLLLRLGEAGTPEEQKPLWAAGPVSAPSPAGAVERVGCRCRARGREGKEVRNRVGQAGGASGGPALQAGRHLRGLCSWGCLGGMPAPSCSAMEGPAPQ